MQFFFFCLCNFLQFQIKTFCTGRRVQLEALISSHVFHVINFVQEVRFGADPRNVQEVRFGADPRTTIVFALVFGVFAEALGNRKRIKSGRWARFRSIFNVQHKGKGKGKGNINWSKGKRKEPCPADWANIVKETQYKFQVQSRTNKKGLYRRRGKPSGNWIQW